MDRRELLRLLGTTAGAAGLTPLQLAALGKLAPGDRGPTQTFFSPEQRETVTALADTIIPTTDTPGAVEAGVVDFIELIVSEWYGADDRELFMRGLTHIDEHAEALTGGRFAQADASHQQAMVSGLEAEGRALMDENDAIPTPFFHRFRGLVLYGYYTSEIGMTQELRWQIIPGRFDGCVPLAEVVRPASESR